MNEVHVAIVIRNCETRETVAELGEASHVIADPGEDVQSVHGWRNYVAERVSLAVRATIAGALSREVALESVPIVSRAEIEQTAAELVAPMTFEEAARQKGLGDLQFEATPAIVSDLLLLIGATDRRAVRPSLEEITAWTSEEREEVAAWAAALHAFASDNDEVEVPPYPAVLLRGDDDAKDAGHDAGAEGEASGAAGTAPAGGEGGAADAGADDAGAGAGAQAGDPGADPGTSGEGHVGSEGAAAGDEGGGAVSRPRGRRRRGEEAPA